MTTKTTRTGTDGSIEIITVYDDGSKYVCKKDSNGFEEWWKYDENGNKTHYKDNNLIYFKEYNIKKITYTV